MENLLFDAPDEAKFPTIHYTHDRNLDIFAFPTLVMKPNLLSYIIRMTETSVFLNCQILRTVKCRNFNI